MKEQQSVCAKRSSWSAQCSVLQIDLLEKGEEDAEPLPHPSTSGDKDDTKHRTPEAQVGVWTG